MGKFKPYRIKSNQLDSLPITEGQLIFTTDTKKMYIDTDSSTRLVFDFATEEFVEEKNKNKTKISISKEQPEGLVEGDIWGILE